MPVSTAGTTTTVTSELPQCTQATDQSGPLITFVTDRETSSGENDYSDDAPSSTSYAGAYNKSVSGASTKLNYSTDGKCFVSGRELPSVIPLTSSKSTLESFFTNATIGGGTPGHLGHAWASYLISPNWNSVFGTTAADYDDENTDKYVVLMTDGEYNMQYSSETSRTQALAYCSAMKEKGIKVYTVGFGFAVNPTGGSADANARELLTLCSSGSGTYYFPYDGDELREAFSNIGTSIKSGSDVETVKITN